MADLASVLSERTVLHLGSGRKYDPQAVNVDLVSTTNPDVVHNLDLFPWPFPDGRFREVCAYDVVEHLENIVRVMEEMHRVCSDGAIVKITVPHYSCSNAFTDPTHRHFFSSASFDYFTGDNELGFYTDRHFRKQTASIRFQPSLTNKLISRLANRWPAAYEQRWAWMFPAWYLYFELAVVKSPNR